MRITTPLHFSEFFYFNFNPKCAEWDEIFGSYTFVGGSCLYSAAPITND
jgi:hypothetical protein